MRGKVESIYSSTLLLDGGLEGLSGRPRYKRDKTILDALDFQASRGQHRISAEGA